MSKFNFKSKKSCEKKIKQTEIIYGKNACFGCLQSYNNNIKNREIYQVYILQTKFDEYYKKVPQAFRDLIRKCNSHELFSITHEQDKHQGIALKVSNFHFTDIDELIERIDKINNSNYTNNTNNINDINDVNKNTNKKVSIFLLDGLQDPHNIGNIIRSSFCFNIDAIILTEHNSCGITPAVVRTSAGYSEYSLICQAKNTALTIEKLKKNGYWIIGFDVNTNTKDDITKVIKKYEKCVFIFGSEGQGMKDLTKKNCDIIIKLPMNKQAESLNVANTAAIIGWEILKSNNQNC